MRNETQEDEEKEGSSYLKVDVVLLANISNLSMPMPTPESQLLPRTGKLRQTSCPYEGELLQILYQSSLPIPSRETTLHR